MAMSSNYNIEIVYHDNEDAVYYPGQTVKGKWMKRIRKKLSLILFTHTALIKLSRFIFKNNSFYFFF